MPSYIKKEVPGIKVGKLVEENTDSIASSFIQQKNLILYEKFEEQEEELKKYIKDLIERFSDLNRDQLKAGINHIYEQICLIDKRQDVCINKILNLATHIGKINSESNQILMDYDVKGTYKDKKVLEKTR